MRFTGEQETSAIISHKSYLGTIIIGLMLLIKFIHIYNLLCRRTH